MQKLNEVSDRELELLFKNAPDCWKDGKFDDELYEKEVEPIEFEYYYRILVSGLCDDDVLRRFADWMIKRLESEYNNDTTPLHK